MVKKRARLKRVRARLDDGCVYEYYPLGKYIVMAPGVCGGRPTFKGTRIEVQVILDWLRMGRSIERILKGYPSLTRAAVEEAVELATQAFLEHYPPPAA